MSCSLDALIQRSAGSAAAPGPLLGAVDAGRVAFVGHSFGGATALMAAEQDPRARAVASWDAWVQSKGPVPPEMLAAGLRRCPQLLAVCSDWAAGGEVIDQIRSLAAGGRCVVVPPPTHPNPIRTCPPSPFPKTRTTSCRAVHSIAELISPAVSAGR